MCGRFALHLEDYEVMTPDVHQRILPTRWINRDRYVPRYNVAPRTHALVLRRDDTSEGDLVIHTMKWGVIPHWSKYEDKSLNTTNARSENLIDGGGMWNSLKGSKRCAVLCEGYYEWQTKGKNKIPYFTTHKAHKLMLLAGLWDVVTLRDATEPLYTFTIVTAPACRSFEWLHDRQPVILTSQSSLDTWLDPTQPWSNELHTIVHPYTGPGLNCFQVPTEVGRVGTESSSFIQPVSKRKDGIEAMFNKQRQSPVKSKPTEPIDVDEQNPNDEECDKTLKPLQKETEGYILANEKEDPLSQADSTPTKKRSPAPTSVTPSPRKKRRMTAVDNEKIKSSKLTSFFTKKEP